MYDAAKIVPGLIIAVVLLTFPVWYNLASGKSPYAPEIEKPVGEKQCVESAEFMRSFHMDLLNDWRDAVVRRGLRIYTSSDGARYEMSLSGTCMRCHSNKSTFCDRCHDYAGVDPYCWDCHVEPVENE